MYRRYIIFHFEFSNRHKLAQVFLGEAPPCRSQPLRGDTGAAGQADDRYDFFRAHGPFAKRLARAPAAGWRDLRISPAIGV